MTPKDTTVYPRTDPFPDVPVSNTQSGLQPRVIRFVLDPTGDADGILKLCLYGQPLRLGSNQRRDGQMAVNRYLKPLDAPARTLGALANLWYVRARTGQQTFCCAYRSM
jgi:hypothetical protein